MKKITKLNFSKQYAELTFRKKIHDCHYYYDRDKKGHGKLLKELGNCNVWSVIMYGNHVKKTHKDLPKIFRNIPRTWEQLFFIEEKDSNKIVIYRGNSLGSGYRYTHGVMANAFALLDKKIKIKTFVLSQGKRGGLHIHEFESFRANGHELNGNYPISHEEVDRNVPKKIRIYSQIT
ncbi:MAG: hypothetical protein GY754_18095 [bacterium]|nr:hypothetical protein [bacterium]